MPSTRAFSFLPLLLVPLFTGCAQEASREHVVSRLTQSESQVFPDHAVWEGDANGYHYIHVRNIYCLLGDKDYKVPVATWDLADPFPLTDDASKWRNVQWEDKDALMRSRFAYVLLEPKERVDSPSVHAESQPTTDITPYIMQPTTDAAPATQPAVPTTQPASRP